MKDKKVLIIDDDDGIRDSLSLVLEGEGYSVKTVADGRLAEKYVSEYNPSVILLDVLMSGVDGRDICKKLKQDDKFKKIPVIMISAHPSAKESALSYGAQDFLEKPFNVDNLLSLISKQVS